jgi:NAD(P)-dependent dehydrogenase (short-subunit alcohol dehydrogenase family)
MKRLSGKVAIVTGAAQGMGLAISRLFVREGARVALIDIQGEKLAHAAAGLVGGEAPALPLVLDIADPAAVRRAVEQAAHAWGRVDVLVNNAALQAPGGTLAEATDEDWDRYLAVNVKGAGYLAREAIPWMVRSGGGSIINISSISGMVVFPSQAVYATTKGALIQMTRAIAVDFGPDGIRANAICPGPTLSGPLDRPAGQEGEQALLELARRDPLAAQHPLGRIALPDDIAYAALFLASDESRHISGIILPVDGGFTAR